MHLYILYFIPSRAGEFIINLVNKVNYMAFESEEGKERVVILFDKIFCEVSENSCLINRLKSLGTRSELKNHGGDQCHISS